MADLQLHGHLGCAMTPRSIPSVHQPVLRDGDRILLPDGTAYSVEEFAEWAEEDLVTLLSPEPAKTNFCVFYPEHTHGPQYISLASAAGKLLTFAQAKVAQGDAAFDEQDPARALACYELAASAAQRPLDYERMLRCPMDAIRRARIERLRDQAVQSYGHEVEAT